jgi:hypothetical protein
LFEAWAGESGEKGVVGAKALGRGEGGGAGGVGGEERGAWGDGLHARRWQDVRVKSESWGRGSKVEEGFREGWVLRRLVRGWYGMGETYADVELAEGGEAIRY